MSLMISETIGPIHAFSGRSNKTMKNKMLFQLSKHHFTYVLMPIVLTGGYRLSAGKFAPDTYVAQSKYQGESIGKKNSCTFFSTGML